MGCETQAIRALGIHKVIPALEIDIRQVSLVNRESDALGRPSFVINQTTEMIRFRFFLSFQERAGNHQLTALSAKDAVSEP